MGDKAHFGHFSIDRAISVGAFVHLWRGQKMDNVNSMLGGWAKTINPHSGEVPFS